MRRLLIAGGTLALGLGAVGVFLPFLPTTPFLLLAAACYLRSSPWLYTRLMGSRVLGKYIQDYYEHRRMVRKAKAVTVSLLWLTIGFSCYLSGFDLLTCILLVTVSVGVSIHIALLRTGVVKPVISGEEPTSLL